MILRKREGPSIVPLLKENSKKKTSGFMLKIRHGRTWQVKITSSLNFQEQSQVLAGFFLYVNLHGAFWKVSCFTMFHCRVYLYAKMKIGLRQQDIDDQVGTITFW